MAQVIYEATFNEDGIFAMADILVKNGDTWDMYEVKASTQVKDVHINDVAIQWYALGKVLNLNHAYVIHINNKYIREGELNIEELFTVENVTDEVIEKQEEIEPQLLEMKSMLKEDVSNIDIGGHCSDPYGCDFSS